MFGVSLHSGYHSLALAVEVAISGTVKIYWMDQYSRAGFAKKTDVSSVKAMDKKVYAGWLRPKYGYKRITVWPILPPESIPEPETVNWRPEAMEMSPEEELGCEPEP